MTSIHNNLEGYLLLLLSMWPVLVVLFLGLSLAFYGVLMRKVAIIFVILSVLIGLTGWLYG